MNSLKEGVKNIWEKFKGFSKAIKIAIITSLVLLIIAIISIFFYSSANKYKILFSELDVYDSQIVIEKLTEKKVDMKIEGTAILVPKEQVDQLRLELAPELTSGSHGYELMDTGSSFGMTDEEFQIKKLRMQQGELEKTIKSFPQVADARVHITPAQDSVFVSDKKPGKAAVYIKLATGKKLETNQVESIMALVSGSTDNIPLDNIEVIDDNMNLLSKDLKNEDSSYVDSNLILENLDLEKRFESELEKSIVELLTPVIGLNKVKAVVNADLDFDSKQKTETIIDPNKVIVSQNTIKEQNGSLSQTVSGGPVDENMSNVIVDNNDNDNSGSLKEEQLTNYEVGKTENKVISAPGEVRRLTASVIVDGELQGNLQTAIEKAVQTAIGFKGERGDEISVVGITFDPTLAENNDNITNPIAENDKNNIFIYLGVAAAVIVVVIVLFIIRNKKKANDEVEEELALDVVIDDKITKVPQKPLAPIDFEEPNPQVHLETEIKKYASEKPDQVVDIIKSWLAESER